ncbi:MAG: sugar porter family MFS transporter [Bacteroides sp.]|nr:sugar porter family MFS transporter [Bacteroides sp.]
MKYNTRYILFISLISALGGFLFGYDWVVIGGAKFFYERFFEITQIPHLQGIAMSSALIGCIPGALFAGYLSDRFGRKNALISAAVLFMVSALGSGFSDHFVSFMLFRILGGLGVGMASVVSPIYIAEVSPRHMRGKLVALNQLNIVVGILLAQITNVLISEEVPLNASDAFILSSWNGQMAWRWMFWAETIPAGIFFIMTFFIPESPRWLIRSGFSERALLILNRIGGSTYGSSILSEIKISLKESSRKINYRVLLSKKVRPVLILGLVLAFFQQWCGINIVFNYAEEVFTSAGFGISDSLLNIVATGVVNLVFTLVALRTVDNWGRKKLMLTGAAGLAITYLVLGACYYYELGGTVVLMVILVAIALYGMTLAPVTWVILSEIFPNQIRGAAMAVASTALWISSTLLVLLFPVIRSWIQISGAFWLYAGICLLGFFYVRARLPETKGKSLEEIERMTMP